MTTTKTLAMGVIVIIAAIFFAGMMPVFAAEDDPGIKILKDMKRNDPNWYKKSLGQKITPNTDQAQVRVLREVDRGFKKEINEIKSNIKDLKSTMGDLTNPIDGVIGKLQKKVNDLARAHCWFWLMGIFGSLGFGLATWLFFTRRQEPKPIKKPVTPAEEVKEPSVPVEEEKKDKKEKK